LTNDIADNDEADRSIDIIVFGADDDDDGDDDVRLNSLIFDGVDEETLSGMRSSQ
jgi:hypothetical protein